ncbi:hypothetical protein H632_c342p0 [Helicosporidium sp. ATCC 50920]|nr:hypothetical protein H632_c342p0 [Helicosporidium sp. ATCC 50920]|eukprot:KDD76131.1 hypothetical protein H632_c342p0 [Helicosporidium sp. ATCC 50920]
MGTSVGACGYGQIPKNSYPYFKVAALSPQNKYYQAGPVDACGQCFEIQCTEGGSVCIGPPVTVMISDECPECSANHIDIQSLAFASLADPGLGIINMRYRRVTCEPSTDIKVAVLDYQGAGAWLRLSIVDTGGRGAVKAVMTRTSGTDSWVQLTNTWGAQWELPSAPAPPLDFKIVCDDNETVESLGVVDVDGGISSDTGGVQFGTGVQFGVGQVQAFNGPSVSASASASAGGSFSASASASASVGGCSDVQPDSNSCQQQMAWGKCNSSDYVKNNWCAQTCGRCSVSASLSTSGPAAAAVAISSVGGSASTSFSSSPGCQGVETKPDSNSCQQQKDWGKCNAPDYISNNWCAQTCGRCAVAAAAAPAPSSSPDCQGAETKPDSNSCQQQKDWGKCNAPDYISNNWCAQTCGRCAVAAAAAPAPSSSPGCQGAEIKPDSNSCQQQKNWGKCDTPDYVKNNWCAQTCGRCQ